MNLPVEKLKRFHFLILLIFIGSFGLNESIGLRLNNNLTIILKGILYLSGIILFFVSIRPFKSIALYYSLFFMTPLVLVAFYFLHGVLLGVLSSVALAPIEPLNPRYNKDGIKIYSKARGFFGSCCQYYATEAKFMLFEEKKTTIQTDEVVDLDNATITVRNDSILISANKPFEVVPDRY